MPASPRIKAVFFDAGETMVYPHPSFSELFAEVLGAEGHVVDPAAVQRVVSVYSSEFEESVKTGEIPMWSVSPEASRAYWDSVYRSFLRDVGVHVDHHDQLVDRLIGRFTDLASYRLHPDVLPTLERLRAAGLSLAVVSNFEEWLERLLESLGVIDYFPVRVISGIEGVEKPDPEIFRIALARVGVEGRQSVYVGDHPFFDVSAAREAGMVPVLIDRRGRYEDADSIRITSLEDLPGLLGLEA